MDDCVALDDAFLDVLIRPLFVEFLFHFSPPLLDDDDCNLLLLSAAGHIDSLLLKRVKEKCQNHH